MSGPLYFASSGALSVERLRLIVNLMVQSRWASLLKRQHIEKVGERVCIVVIQDIQDEKRILALSDAL